MKFDDTDIRILKALQQDTNRAVGDIAEEVGISPTPCWRRIKRLEEAGVVRGRVALLDRASLNLGVTVFVSIRTRQHDQDWLDAFAKNVGALPEVVELYLMSGDVDYLLKVVVPDIAGYDAFYKKLIKVGALSDVSSSFAMEQIKYTTALPLDSVRLS